MIEAAQNLVELVELTLEMIPVVARVEAVQGLLDLAQGREPVDPRQDGWRQNYTPGAIGSPALEEMG